MYDHVTADLDFSEVPNIMTEALKEKFVLLTRKSFPSNESNDS